MRFRVQVNGEHICDAGVERNGMIYLSLETHHKDPENPAAADFMDDPEVSRGTAAFLVVSGTEDMEIGKRIEDTTPLMWTEKRALVGDEIRIQLLPDGEITQPEVEKNPKYFFAPLGTGPSWFGRVRGLFKGHK